MNVARCYLGWASIAVGVSVLAVGIVGTGCQKPVQSKDSESLSKTHLRTALIALDSGDDTSAESELQLSLKIDPLNNRARTVLASLYAQRAGFPLSKWLDPFWKAAKQLSGRLGEYQKTEELYEQASDTMRLIGETSGIDSYEAETIKQAQVVMRAFGRIALGVSVTMNVFTEIPTLTDQQLAELDKAIEVLRYRNEVAPEDRSEESRVYLSILSTCRLVNSLKRAIGDENFHKLAEARERLCSLEKQQLSAHLQELRTSLEHLEEGLVVGSNDSPTSQREARRRMQEFVSRFLMGEAMRRLERILDESTAEGKAAKIAAEKFCESRNQ